MAFPVVAGTTCQCSFGAAPSSLMVLPEKRILTESKPMACILDNKPMVNVQPFGMCSSLANPTVASATSAAMGVLTPMPCVPVTVAPWAPGSPTVLVGGVPALNNSCKLMCNWGGVISVVFSPAVKEQIK